MIVENRQRGLFESGDLKLIGSEELAEMTKAYYRSFAEWIRRRPTLYKPTEDAVLAVSRARIGVENTGIYDADGKKVYREMDRGVEFYSTVDGMIGFVPFVEDESAANSRVWEFFSNHKRRIGSVLMGGAALVGVIGLVDDLIPNAYAQDERRFTRPVHPMVTRPPEIVRMPPQAPPYGMPQGGMIGRPPIGRPDPTGMMIQRGSQMWYGGYPGGHPGYVGGYPGYYGGYPGYGYPYGRHPGFIQGDVAVGTRDWYLQIGFGRGTFGPFIPAHVAPFYGVSFNRFGICNYFFNNIAAFGGVGWYPIMPQWLPLYQANYGMSNIQQFNTYQTENESLEKMFEQKEGLFEENARLRERIARQEGIEEGRRQVPTTTTPPAPPAPTPVPTPTTQPENIIFESRYREEGGIARGQYDDAAIEFFRYGLFPAIARATDNKVVLVPYDEGKQFRTRILVRDQALIAAQNYTPRTILDLSSFSNCTNTGAFYRSITGAVKDGLISKGAINDATFKRASGILEIRYGIIMSGCNP